MNIFVLIIDSDTNENENFFFAFNPENISIDEISDALEIHKKATEENDMEYNYVLAIRKLESLGLKQITAYIKEM